MSLLRFTVALCLTALDVESAALEVSTADDLDRYVGNYTFLFRNITLGITRDGDRLVARPSANFPSITLEPQKTRGRFWTVGAAFEFHFITDGEGKVTGIEMTEPDGKKHTFARLFDPAAAAAPFRAIAVNADTSVNARVYNGYERVKGTDGRFKGETYTFGEGGLQGGGPKDKSIDELSFERIAHEIAPALAAQGYISGTDIEHTDLLLMVYWGSSQSEDHPAVITQEMREPANHSFRDQLNRQNAGVLGFQDALNVQSPAGFQSSRARDLLDDLEESRYWVVLIAVDLRTMVKEKRTKPLWSIRYNIRSQGTDFVSALPQMTQFASHYFGRDSEGLVNPSTRDQQGRVELGEQKVIRVEPE